MRLRIKRDQLFVCGLGFRALGPYFRDGLDIPDANFDTHYDNA
jgi:hypothetical protein